MHELRLVEPVVVQGTAVHVVKAFQRQETQLSPSQEQTTRTEFHGGRLQSLGQQELSYSIFPAAQSTAYKHTLSLLHYAAVMGSRRLQEDSLDGEGGFKSLLWYRWAVNGTEYMCCLGRSHHDPRLYSDTEALGTRSRVLNTTGLYNDYTLYSVLSPMKLKLDHQTVFPCERVWSGHDTREGGATLTTTHKGGGVTLSLHTREGWVTLSTTHEGGVSDYYTQGRGREDCTRERG